MARRAGPSVKSRRLAFVLKRLRIGAGVTGTDVARQTDISASKLSRMESAEIGVYLDDVEKLLDFYRVTAQKRVELLDIARHAEQRGWLRMNNPNLPSDWQTWVDFEDEANAIKTFEPAMIPGLLQTPEYAGAVIRATGGEIADHQVEALVASRMARQGVLTRIDPLQLHVIIEEAVLRRDFGKPGALARQLRHLTDAGEQENIAVRVLPADTGLHAGLNGSFVILEYDTDPSLVLLENRVASLFLDEDEHINAHVAAWTALLERARPEADSAKLIADTARELAG
ncbi:MAG: helix-turn-helix domain-containing protein [Sciscionella sp.]